MKLAELTPQVREKIAVLRYDWIVEKHEGPWSWSDGFQFHDFDFLDIDGHAVLLPIEKEQFPNVTILRVIESADGASLTIFLKNTTWVENPENEFLDAGFLAVCDKLDDENFYVAHVYHEWFILDEM